MTDVIGYPIYITTGSRNRTPGVTTASRAKNVLISNVIATGIDAQSGIQITGLPGQPLEDLRLENIRLRFKGGGTREQADAPFRELAGGYPEPAKLGITPAYGIYVRHVRGVELANLHVNFDSDDLRPPLACSDVSDLEIDNLKAQVAQGVTPWKFENVSGVVIRNSPGFEPAQSQAGK